jgi:hypothetical protein
MQPTRWLVTACLLPLLFACGDGGSGSGSGGQDPDPFVNDVGLAFVRRPVMLDDTTGALVQPDLREALTFNEGADLFYRELASPSAKELNVTGGFTGGLGDVKDVEVSYDGSKLLFAMRAPEIPDADPEDQPKWNIWEYAIASKVLRRIITSDITAEAGQDIAPHYLPDSRIIFSSTRQRQSKAVLLDEGKQQFAALDEDRNERALVLHVMNSDGSDIRQVSFNQSHDLDPTVLSTGEVMFCRWDNMGNRNAISLYKMHPDGTELQLLYGSHSHDTGTNNSEVQFIQARERSDGNLQSIILPFTGSYQGGELVLIDSENYIDNNGPTAINQGFLTGPAQTSATINDVHTDNTVSPGGLFSSAWPLHDGTDRILVSWSQCRLVENNTIVPCTPDRLANPNAVAADPLYGIFLYNRDDKTQQPVVVPKEGTMFTDVVAAEPRILPAILFDKAPGGELDPQLVSEGVGVLNIRSVYDVDGVDTAAPDIPTLADPGLTITADDRPARFLRIVKAVGIPDDEVLDLPGTAFGRSSAQLMREIIGYAPVQPDGSVRVKVPADVPLAISVLDREGRRLGSRHQNWLQVRAGETLNCTGCHDHASNTPHGHPEGPVSVYAGALLTGPPFPNTEPTLFANFGESMAETLTRLDDTMLSPTVDIFFDDVWTDPATAGRAKDTSFSYEYLNLLTPAPASDACQTGWSYTCRTVIHYEQHIHPLWSVDRGANTCTGCHTTDNGGGLMVPEAQLDLTDGASDQQADHFKSYRELLFGDNAQEDAGGILQDIMVDGPIDPNTGLPTQVPVPVAPSMSAAGAIASTRFTTVFDPGGTHDGRLDPAELRLVYEWLDIGAQYWNDPFTVPP